MHLRAAKYTSSPKGSRLKASVDTQVKNSSQELSYWSQLFDDESKTNKLTKSPLGFVDKKKQLEMRIHQIVEHSTRLVDESLKTEKFALALNKAKEALSSYDSLRLMIQQEDGKALAPVKLDEEPKLRPLTQNINLMELSVMVNSNLAYHLQTNLQYEQSVEVYTEICRLASGTSVDLAIAQDSLNTKQRQANEFKLLLYRFGLNIANVYYLQGQHQRALKHYRLTLDRLSSLKGYKNLLIKLMSNISLSLLEMRPQISDDGLITHQEECVKSFDLLVKDNLEQISGRVHNANHHQFGLNLMSCMHQKADLKSMMKTLENLVKADMSHQYESHAIASPIDHHQILRLANDSGVASRSSFESKGRAAIELSRQVQFEPENLHVGSHELERLIRERKDQTSECLLMSCLLLIDLSRTLKLDDLSNFKSNSAKTHDDGQASDALDYCIQLLKTSETHKSLADDLIANSLCRILTNGHKLDEAIDILSDLSRRQPQGVTNTVGHPVKTSVRDSNQRLASGVLNGLAKCSSPSTAINLSAWLLIEGRADYASEVGQLAVRLNDSNAAAWVNLANCHYHMNQLDRAIDCYTKAKLIDATNWQVNYNQLIIKRKCLSSDKSSQLNINEITRSDRRYISTLVEQKLILEPLQVALTLSSYGKDHQAIAVLSHLTEGVARDSPEVHLLASKVVSRSDEMKTGNRELSPTIRNLESVRQEHPYHIGLNQRLIALYIDSFEYNSAKGLIRECIRNRPDQVKWYHILAECHRRATEYNDSIAVLKEAIKLFPQDSSLVKKLAKLAEELGLGELQNWCSERLDTTS